MPLKNKYIKYFPDITSEIFDLIKNKILSLNLIGKEYNWCDNNYLKFKEYGYIDIWNHPELSWRVNNNKSNCDKQITVQELLGYDPFVKDEFVLPKYWHVIVTKENLDILSKWRFNDSYFKLSINNITGISSYSDEKAHNPKYSIADFGIEITFEQFQKYVLKEEDFDWDKYETVEKDWSKASKEELLEEAKRRYPIDTKYCSAYDNYPGGEIISSSFDCDGDGVYHNGKYIYYRPEKRWAIIYLDIKPKLLEFNSWYQAGNHIVYLYERNKVYGFHHNEWFTSYGFNEKDLKSVDFYIVQKKFTKYIKETYLTSFVDLVNEIDFKIENYNLNFSNNQTQIYISVKENTIRGNKSARIFNKGIWAKQSKTMIEYVEIITKNENYNNWLNNKDKVKDHYNNKYKNLKIVDSNTNYYGELVYLLIDPDNNYACFKASACISFTKSAFDAQKQSLKQAVHCTSQEEWDFVSEKIGYKFQTKFNENFNTICLENNNSGGIKSYFERENYQILSFQEWSDLNNYTMEIKYKKGDWIIVTKEHSGCNGKLGQLYQLIKDPDQIYGYLNYEEYLSIDPKSVGVRLATSDEIKNHLQQNVKFESGEWYKYYVSNQMFYLKCLKFENKIFYNDGYIDINDNKGIVSQQSKYNNLQDFQGKVSIDEIKRYLPKKQTTMLEKDKYYVCLRPSNLCTGNIKYNYCYQQKIDDNTISPIICSQGTSSSSMNERNLEYHRLATDQEIEEYKKLGKPYDISTLKNNFKVDDWVYAEKVNQYDYRTSEFIPIFQIKELVGNWLRPTKGIGKGIESKYCRYATAKELNNKFYPKKSNDFLHIDLESCPTIDYMNIINPCAEIDIRQHQLYQIGIDNFNQKEEKIKINFLQEPK